MMNAAAIQSPTHTLVVGLGKTGFSVAAYLLQRGELVTVADSRQSPPYLQEMNQAYPHVSVLLGDIPVSRLGEFDQVVVSPGIAVETDVDLIGDIELFARDVNAPVIAITGSNGKSTVTMLVYEMLLAAGLRVEVAGNIGTPALECLANTQSDPVDFYVLELSSFQLESTSNLHCASAVVLNLSEDHMDRYDDLASYSRAKQRIFAHCQSGVVNLDDAETANSIAGVTRIVGFGLTPPKKAVDFGIAMHQQNRWFMQGDIPLAAVEDMQLLGEQNVSNVLAAMALLHGAGIEMTSTAGKQAIKAALVYKGLPHRCEVVGRWQGVAWINDSKATNVGATVAAINGFAKNEQRNLLVIAGGQGKQADFSLLAETLNVSCSELVLFGEDADKINHALKATNKVIPGVHFVESLQYAIEKADELCHLSDSQIDTVLFSPACASFDMFSSFEHRGDVFRSLVCELKLEEVVAWQ